MVESNHLPTGLQSVLHSVELGSRVMAPPRGVEPLSADRQSAVLAVGRWRQKILNGKPARFPREYLSPNHMPRRREVPCGVQNGSGDRIRTCVFRLMRPVWDQLQARRIMKKSCRPVIPTARSASPCGLPGLRLQSALHSYDNIKWWTPSDSN